MSRHELIVHLANTATGIMRAAGDSQLSDQPWLPETSNLEPPCFAFHGLITARLDEMDKVVRRRMQRRLAEFNLK